MIKHSELGDDLCTRQKHVFKLIKAGKITLAGYRKQKIYGRLNCASGKRIKIENRVFFDSETAAIIAGYRPCGHCLPIKYLRWKNSRNDNEHII